MQNGFLTISVIDSTTNRPIKDARINIFTTADSGEGQSTIYQNL